MSRVFKRGTPYEENIKRAIRTMQDGIPRCESPFYATRTLFRGVLGYEPWSYEEWLSLEDKYKAAALYVTFFDQITLAWSKAKSFYVVDEDGVSEMMKYLMKNTPIIINDKKKFSAAYIYKVAYNCLYCVSRDIKRDRDAYENNVPQYVQVGDDVLDLFDTVIDATHPTEVMDKKRFWSLIDEQPWDTKAIIVKILEGGALPAGIPMKRRKAIMEELKEVFAAYKPLFYGEDEQEEDVLTFARVLAQDDEIESAVVEMPNGESAVYYGQKLYDESGNIKMIELFGATEDYLVPVEEAKGYTVTDVAFYK